VHLLVAAPRRQWGLAPDKRPARERLIAPSAQPGRGYWPTMQGRSAGARPPRTWRNYVARDVGWPNLGRTASACRTEPGRQQARRQPAGVLQPIRSARRGTSPPPLGEGSEACEAASTSPPPLRTDSSGRSPRSRAPFATPRTDAAYGSVVAPMAARRTSSSARRARPRRPPLPPPPRQVAVTARYFKQPR
jgi:hypothetical protein